MIKSISKILLNTFLVLLYISMVVVILGLALSQTEWFRDKIKSTILTTAETSVKGKLQIGAIEGNFFSRLTLQDIQLIHENGDTLVSVETVSMNYMPIFLLVKSVNIASLKITRPVFNYISDSGISSWDDIFISSDTTSTIGQIDSTSTDEFPFEAITIKMLTIEDGKVKLISNKHSSQPPTTLQYDHLDFTHLNLRTSLKYNQNGTSFDLQHFSVKELISGFHVANFSTQIGMDNHQLSVKNMNIKTDSSQINIDISLNFLDGLLFDSLFVDRLGRAEIKADIQLSPFHFYDLFAFVPDVDILNKEIQLETTVSGTLRKLEIEKLQLALGQETQLFASGYLTHVLNADSLQIHVGITKGTLFYPDIHQLLPTIEIPDFISVGIIDFKADFSGYPTNFKSNIDLQTESSGQINGTALLNFNHDQPIYDISANVKNVNLSDWLGGKELISDISLSANLKGNGFHWGNDQISASLKIKPSTFTSYQLSQGEIRVGTEKGVLNSTATLDGLFGNVTWDIQVTEEEKDLYAITGTARTDSLNLKTFVPDLVASKLNSVISLDLLIGEEQEGKILINLNELLIDTLLFTPGLIVVDVKNIPSVSTSVEIESDLLDASFSSTRDVNFWKNWITNLITQFEITEDQKKLVVAGKKVAAVTDSLNSISVEMTIKNIDPLGVLFQLPQIRIGSTIEGSLVTQGSFLSVELNAKMDSLQIDQTIEINGINITLEVDSIGIFDLIDYAVGTLYISAKSVYIGKRNWGDFTLISDINRGMFSLDGTLIDFDNILSVEFLTKNSFSSNQLKIGVDNILISSFNEDWLLTNPAEVEITGKNIKVSNLELKNADQRIYINGGISTIGDQSILFKATGIQSEKIFNMITPNFITPAKTNISIDGKIFGSITSPRGIVSLTTSPISIGKTVYGELNAHAFYSEDYLSFSGSLDKSRVGKNIFRYEGYIPFQSINKENKKDLYVQILADQFELSLIQGFLPTITELSGFMSTNILIGGSLENPEINGRIVLNNGSIRSELNNVRYTKISGEVNITNELIRINSFSASSNNGSARVSGTLRLEDFLPRRDYNINLDMSSFSILDKSANSESNYSGEVEVNGSLALRGNYDQSSLTGEIRVRRALFNLVTAGANSRAYSETNFISFVGRNSKVANTDTTARREIIYQYRKKEVGFLSGLTAYIQFHATQNTFLNIVLNRATGEQITTELNGSLAFNYQRQDLNTSGNLNVSSGKYNFYTSQFDLDRNGQIKWTGPLENPELDLLARTTIIRQAQKAGSLVGGAESTEAEYNVITLAIKGTPQLPEITYNIHSSRGSLDNSNDVKSTVTDPQMRDNAAANIVSLLLIGQWVNDPRQAGAGTINYEKDITSSTLNAGLGVLSNHLGRFLASSDNKFRYINLQVHGDQGIPENYEGVVVYDIDDKWSITGGVNYQTNENRTNLQGNESSKIGLSFRVENKITENLSWDIFQRYDPYTFIQDDQIVRGISLFYRKNFYRWADLWRREETYEEKKATNESGPKP